MKNIVAFISGILFAVGLSLGGMTQPDIVKGFLDITNNWNPTLVGVMLGAIAVHASIYWIIIRKKEKPLLDSQFHIPTSQVIDPLLITGAILFGIGWGLVGVCPGPALTSLTSTNENMYVFIGMMLFGMLLYRAWDKGKRKIS